MYFYYFIFFFLVCDTGIMIIEVIGRNVTFYSLHEIKIESILYLENKDKDTLYKIKVKNGKNSLFFTK